MVGTDLCGSARIDAEFALALVGGRLGFAPPSSHEGKPRVLVEALFSNQPQRFDLIPEIYAFRAQPLPKPFQGTALA